MADVRPDQRGVISAMLSLSRNLGLITGASVMGAVFALAIAGLSRALSLGRAPFFRHTKGSGQDDELLSNPS